METTKIKRITGRILFVLGLGLTLFALVATAQIEPNAGQWKTWVLSSGSQFRLPEPPSQKNSKEEVEVLANLATLRDANALAQIKFWDAGSPSHQWNQLALSEISKFNLNTPRGERVLTLVNVAIYDAMVAAWDSKYTYNRSRPSDLLSGYGPCDESSLEAEEQAPVMRARRFSVERQGSMS